MNESISKISILKRRIKDIVEDAQLQSPTILVYSEGFSMPNYKITIELVPQDSFVDSKGVRWIREK